MAGISGVAALISVWRLSGNRRHGGGGSLALAHLARHQSKTAASGENETESGWLSAKKYESLSAAAASGESGGKYNRHQ
jgi:hypothetical protein